MILDHETVLIDNSSESKVFDFGATSWGGGIGNLDGDWEIVVTKHDGVGPNPFGKSDAVEVQVSVDEQNWTSAHTVDSALLEGKSMVRIPASILKDQVARYLKMVVSVGSGSVTAAIVLESPRNNVTL